MAAKESSRPTYKVHTAVIHVQRTAFWTIEQFPTLVNAYANTEGLRSPDFEIKLVGSDSRPVSTKWYFECHPAGETENDDGYVSLHLHISKQTPCPDGTKVAGKFSSPESTISWESYYHDINSYPKLGSSKFYSHKKMKDHPMNYLIKDKLHIKCEMSFLLVGKSRLNACNSRLELADVNAKARDRQAWQDLKANTVVDLGPSLVTLAFGDGGKEEACHTFPMAARSPVFRKMLTVDMLEKASGRIELPHISAATGRQCSEFVWFLMNESNRLQPLNLCTVSHAG
jgi:hypothetical protein